MSKLQLHDSLVVRRIFIALGFVALVLGLFGVVLPVLPTTPFVLLAAACFARGSERFHNWLLDHHISGPLIRDWYHHRSMRPGIKRWAFLLMALSFGSSILLVKLFWLKIMLAGIGVSLAVLLWRIPVRAAAD